MAIYFGKFSDKFPTQIENGFYETDRHEMFGGLQVGDLVYAIGGGKIQLWKAKKWLNNGSSKKMEFEIISKDLGINTNEFIAFDRFVLSKALIIYTMRQGKKAFFEIMTTPAFKDSDLLDLNSYRKKENYRTLRCFSSEEQLDTSNFPRHIDVAIYKKDNNWQILNPGFAEIDVFKDFKDNTTFIGKGRKFKDSTLRKINESNFPCSFEPNVLSIRSFYDAFCVNYNAKEIELETEEISINEIEPKIMKTPLNQILYGPPGTGKTYSTTIHALSIIEEKSVEVLEKEPMEELLKRYKEYKEKKIIDFVTFHQSYGYEEFIEGIKPALTKNEEMKEEELESTIIYKIEDGIFKDMCSNADSYVDFTSEKKDGFSIDLELLKDKNFHKISLGNTLGNSGDIIYNYCKENECIAIGWGGEDVDYSGVKDRKEIKERFESAGYNSKEVFNINAIERLALWIKKGDIIFVSHGTKILKAVGIVDGDYEYRPNSSLPFQGYNHFRKVKWLIVDAHIPVHEVYYANFSHQSIYTMWSNQIKKEFFASNSNVIKVKNHVLIIDEINRGNVSAIFGELITLIEEDKRKGKPNELSVTLPYSKEKFSVPSNLYLIGTMNTADRSVEALDTALRRRFSFTEMLPQPELLSPSAMLTRLMWRYKNEEWEDAEYLDKENNLRSFLGQTDEVQWKERIDIWDTKMKGKDSADLDHFKHFDFNGYDLERLLKTINERIEVLVDRDHTIGHAFFMNVNSIEDLRSTFAKNIIPLLQEYFYGNYEKMEMVIGPWFFEQELEKKNINEFFAVTNQNFELPERQLKLKNVAKMPITKFTDAVMRLLDKSYQSQNSDEKN